MKTAKTVKTKIIDKNKTMLKQTKQNKLGKTKMD